MPRRYPSRESPCVSCGAPVQRSRPARSEPKCRPCQRESHGTVSQYKKRGCRCDDCRAAASVAQLAYYHKRRARDSEWHPNGPKGKPADCAACGLPLKFANPRGVWHRECRPHKFYASPEQRLAIYERDNWTCQLCAEPVDQRLPSRDRMSATLDHIVPRSRGGSNDDENLRLAHLVCNSKRGNRMEEVV